jgi:hypothetical protein
MSGLRNPAVAKSETRDIAIPIVGGKVLLRVPRSLSTSTLYKEIATQDICRQRLLGFINTIHSISGSNRELMLCSEQKLLVITRQFLKVCEGLRQFVVDLATFHSNIAELDEAREDVKTFFYSHISGSIEEVSDLHKIVFAADGELSSRRGEFDSFRKILAKIMGMVRTELQKIFAHLFCRDPRNLYRAKGARSQQEILFRQFQRDVEVTGMLYNAVRRLDTYMRGAIIPSDLIKMIAGKIETDQSVVCLFEEETSSFLKDLIDEVQGILLPEINEVLYLDGIWFDEFENIERKARMLADVCLSFKAFFQERQGLRVEIARQIAPYREDGHPSGNGLHAVLHAFDSFETFRYQDVAECVRSIDQILVDLEGTLLQWEKGIAKRAFARDEWREAEPLRRRGDADATTRPFSREDLTFVHDL